MTGLTLPEQVALMEAIAVTPLRNTVHDSVTYDELDNGKVAVQWRGVAFIPKLQLDSVRSTVEAERKTAEMETER